MYGRAAVIFVIAALTGHAYDLSAQVPTRVADITVHAGDVPRRLVGYGLVVGLDRTGDRSFGGPSGTTPTVRSVSNLLRRFNVEVPAEQLRLRNVAAVLVTAQVSPYLRAGGRFEVQVAALGDASSLDGGVLWITPLVTDPDQPPLATAQGPLVIAQNAGRSGSSAHNANSGRIPDGGVLEVDPPAGSGPEPRLALRRPDLIVASQIAAAIDGAFGPGSALVEDPGAIALTPPTQFADNLNGFLTALDTIAISIASAPTVVVDSRLGTVVAGGDARVGPAVVSHRGITLRVGTPSGAPTVQTPGAVVVPPGATVQDVAAGLHAVGAEAAEIAAIFESLRAAGALMMEIKFR